MSPENSNKNRLNSHDDWSPLQEVIVGSARNYSSHDREVTFDTFYHENLYRSDWAYPRVNTTGSKQRRHTIADNYIEELNEDVEAFADLLTSLDIRVLRPLNLPEEIPVIQTFGWDAPPTPALNIRDNTLILGNEIIETPPAIRSRYLETRLLSKHFMHYFRHGARWTTMPRPLLTDMSFDLSYVNDISTTLGGPTEPIYHQNKSSFDVGLEMMLDGAQCLRLGEDIVVNIAHQNHALAVDWLELHLGSRYRLHRVYRMSDNHIDSMILALRPGVFLARHAGVRDLMPEVFRKWRYIIPPEPAPDSFPVYQQNDLILTSPYIDLNVFSIDEQRVVVNESCLGLIQLLDKEGFTTIPVRHRHRRLFGGGFHCFTLDTIRKSEMADYR